ncbi:MAG TPA: hypothetical protein VHH73_03280 [Verrucomicrobiae bacterium]|nr:hypothetical protein [Verrucomicrobiae bacterium]
MIEIKKPVHRKTVRTYPVLYRKARRIVVTIAPGDILEFRELGRRGKWSLNIDTAFKYAIRLRAFFDKAQKKQRKTP